MTATRGMEWEFQEVISSEAINILWITRVLGDLEPMGGTDMALMMFPAETFDREDLADLGAALDHLVSQGTITRVRSDGEQTYYKLADTTWENLQLQLNAAMAKGPNQ